MLKKQYLKAKPVCKVTFEVPKAQQARKVYLAGDFNGWKAESTPLRKLKDGRHTVTVALQPGQQYEFRYLLDGDWHNDWKADAYVPNPFGSDNSVVIT
ncbi:MAG: isoamylase early set domain-containing protein [Anaerolineae bacterium]|nr:isoamylase early set domain-containing protein [Anaerolineae bacterium]